MEFCMEARALKPSLHRELAKTMTQQALLEEFWPFNAANNNVNGSEDFPVDCFLDFSQEKESEIEEEEEFSEEQEEEDKDSLSSVSSQERENDDSNSNSSWTFSSESLLDSEFSEPVEELKELEWVSQFVDDSLSEFSLLYPKPETLAENRCEPEPKPVFPRGPCFSLPAPVPAKARTKRPRTTSRVWSLGSPSLTETTALSSSSSPSSSSSSSFTGLSTVTFDTFNNQVQIEPPAKKPKKKPSVQTNGGVSCGSPVQRRCSHCQVQKTPQWRTGPLGAKTLCNACGVRYKSGRLFPEYRPACSPSFSGDVHSNSHRKVLEMRRKKELAEPESGLTQMVQSF